MAIPATLVRLFSGNPDDPEDFCGMAIIPRGPSWHKKGKPVDPIELDRKLRDLTPDWSPVPVEAHAEAVNVREALIAAGGRPTRPIRDFEPEQANPESVELYGIGHGMYELYSNERSYWDKELQSWQSFLERRRWAFGRLKKKGLVKSSEELPDPKKTDQARLFAEYVAYQQRRIERFDARSA